MKKFILTICGIILCSSFLYAQINVRGLSKDGYPEVGSAEIYYGETGTGTPRVMVRSVYTDSLKFDITTDQAEKMIEENSGKSDFVILDVRTPEEFASGFISGSVNIDIKSPDFQEKINALSKDKTYIVYCKRGGRSSQASDIMKEKGFEKVYNMLGGITKWAEENRKVEIK